MNSVTLGILKHELGWQQILEQEGLLYKVLDNVPAQYSAPIIINRDLNKSEIFNLLNFIKTGGTILINFPSLKFILENLQYKPTKISYITGDNSNILNNISIVDLKLPGYLSSVANIGLIDSKFPAIYERQFDQGFIIALPFDIHQAMCDTRSELKSFYFYPTRKFPFEQVSVTSRGEIRKLAVNCLRKLYQKMNLPYIHLWYYPKDYISVFAFRVDTDFSPESNLKTTLDLENKTQINFTHFINTKAHADITYKTKDIQIHCYEHQVYKDYQTNFDNIRKAKSILENNSINPIGFVSPFGFWNENLQRAIEDNDIQYSSEFSLDYDDLPFFPIINNRLSKTLQIPVHPICIGRLLHAGLAPEECVKYYEQYIIEQYNAREPIFIYDHPHRIHKFTKVFEKIFRTIKTLPLVHITTMTDFYHWWKNRLQIYSEMELSVENQKLEIKNSHHNTKQYLHIITPEKYESFIPLKTGTFNLSDLQYNQLKMNMIKNIDKRVITRTKNAAMQIKFYNMIEKLADILKGK